MLPSTVEIKTNLIPRSIQSIDVSPSEVMNRILTLGYDSLILSGSLIDQFSDGVLLFVEEDVQFLIDEYIYFEEILTTHKPYQHNVYLNDGSLAFTAMSNRTTVEIKFQYCPGLNVADLIICDVTVTENEYIWWWRSISYEIFNLLIEVRSPIL